MIFAFIEKFFFHSGYLFLNVCWFILVIIKKSFCAVMLFCLRVKCWHLVLRCASHRLLWQPSKQIHSPLWGTVLRHGHGARQTSASQASDHPRGRLPSPGVPRSWEVSFLIRSSKKKKKKSWITFYTTGILYTTDTVMISLQNYSFAYLPIMSALQGNSLWLCLFVCFITRLTDLCLPLMTK